jgi:hypothetical protein
VFLYVPDGHAGIAGFILFGPFIALAFPFPGSAEEAHREVEPASRR